MPSPSCKHYYRSWLKQTFTGWPRAIYKGVAAVVAVVSWLIQQFRPDVLGEMGFWFWVIPLAVLAGTVIFGFLYAPYTMHRKVSEELEEKKSFLVPTLEIGKEPRLQERTSGTGKLYRAFYIEIKNGSGTPIEQVKVRLQEIDPPVPNLDWLPVNLRIKHDQEVPPKESFDLSPGGRENIDLVARWADRSEIDICHVVQDVNDKIPIGRKYTLTVSAEGKNLPVPCRARFAIGLDDEGKLTCARVE